MILVVSKHFTYTTTPNHNLPACGQTNRLRDGTNGLQTLCTHQLTYGNPLIPRDRRVMARDSGSLSKLQTQHSNSPMATIQTIEYTEGRLTIPTASKNFTHTTAIATSPICGRHRRLRVDSYIYIHHSSLPTKTSPSMGQWERQENACW